MFYFSRVFVLFAFFFLYNIQNAFADVPDCYHDAVKIGSSSADAFVVTDFNGGPLSDYLTIDQGFSKFMLHVNEGAGVFSEKCLVGSSNCTYTPLEFSYAGCNDGPQNLTAGDLNNDGYPDLVISDFGEIIIAYNIFDPSDLGRTLSLPTYLEHASWANSIRLADLDGDNALDIIIGGNGAYYPTNKGHKYAIIEIALNDGQGNFPQVDFYPVVKHPEGGRAARTTALAQLIDGPAADIALVGDDCQFKQGQYDYIGILPGNADGTFNSNQAIEVPIRYCSRAIAAKDVNNDGLADLLVGSEDGTNLLGVIFNDGKNFTESFKEALWIELPPAPDSYPQVASLLLEDVNNDGDQDLVIARAGSIGHSDDGSALLVHNSMIGEYGFEELTPQYTDIEQVGFGVVDEYGTKGLFLMREDWSEYLAMPKIICE